MTVRVVELFAGIGSQRMALFSVMFGTKGARMEQSTLLRWGVAA